MPRIAIIGLGLIGGSLGLAFKQSRLRDAEIVGFARSRETRDKARKIGAIDRTAASAADAAREAAVVIIATPIAVIPDVMEEIAPSLSDSCIVTDAASSKDEVMRWADELLPAATSFVGGHPMAGKEETGIDVAEATLFEGKPYCIVPSVHASETAVNTVVGLAEMVGAMPVFLDAEEHDSYVAAVSHLPLVVSTALLSLVHDSAAWPEMAQLASSGFRDLTRLASGSPEMSEDICRTNEDNVVHWIDRMISELRRYRELIKGDDDDALFEAFARAKRDRDAFLLGPIKPRRPEKSDQGGIGMGDLLLGRWAASRTREAMKAAENREPAPKRPQRSKHRLKKER
jgi:prephenate dehydrogenase